MILSIEKQRELLNIRSQKQDPHKVAGFDLTFRIIGLCREVSSEEIRITKEIQITLEKAFDNKYREWSSSRSTEVLSECCGILEVLTHIGIRVSVSEEFANTAIFQRYY